MPANVNICQLTQPLVEKGKTLKGANEFIDKVNDHLNRQLLKLPHFPLFLFLFLPYLSYSGLPDMLCVEKLAAVKYRNFWSRKNKERWGRKRSIKS